MFLKTVSVCMALTLQSIRIDQVNGLCCGLKPLKFCEPKGGELYIQSPRCGDCTYQPSHCGTGECNVLGCDCSGGCRTGPCKEDCNVGRITKRQTEAENESELDENGVRLDGMKEGDRNAEQMNDDVTDFIIEAADTDGDGYLNLTEAKFYVYRRQRSTLPEVQLEAEIRMLDRNGDGYLSKDEIDGRAGF